MRQLIILTLALISITSYGQSSTNTNDTANKQVLVLRAKEKAQPAYFVDGKFASGVVLDPQLIDRINVVNGEVQFDKRNYNGQVYLTTKAHDDSRLISLTALKDKYAEFKNKPVIFFIDGSLVKADCDKYVVDERYVLQIKVDTVNNSTENIDLVVIELLTKTDANIKKLKEIRIRGGEVTMN